MTIESALFQRKAVTTFRKVVTTIFKVVRTILKVVTTFLQRSLRRSVIDAWFTRGLSPCEKAGELLRTREI